MVKITALLFFDVTGFLHVLEEVFNKVGPLVAVRAPEQSPEVLYPPVNVKPIYKTLIRIYPP